MDKKAVKTTFSGRVQGVGFRYSAMSIAQNYDISGYVKNLPAGSVELFAQGEESTVDAFVSMVSEKMKRYILDQHIIETAIDPSIKDFRVKY